jgi:3beta-hydroxy-delta5-steroid dehydrogenase/steroid delta-isomerase
MSADGDGRPSIASLRKPSILHAFVQAPDDIGPRSVVVGGSGFLGRRLVTRLLDEGYQVRVLDLTGHPELDSRAQLVRVDLARAREVAAALAGADTVFHTASMIPLTGMPGAALRRRSYEVNVSGTEHILDGCREQGVARLVYTSSVNVVFGPAVVAADESCPYAARPVDLYSCTKIAAERLVLHAGRADAGLATCALRPGGVWGPYAGGLMLEKLLDRIALGLPLLRIGDGSAPVDNTHVDNLAEAHLLAARALARRPGSTSAQAYFITDEEPMDAFEWFEPLLSALGYSLSRARLPVGVAYRAAHACEWLERVAGIKPLLTRAEVLKVTRAHSFRIDKAREQLGYNPRVKRREGLLACVPYARAYLARKRA